jgi:RNA polymerase sigma-70 factor, ECF subfamily
LDQPAKTASDDKLEGMMVAYQAGDAAAAAALISSISPQLHRLFMAHMGSRADADDLLQETWLRLHRVRHTYRAGESVLPWLYAIARHVRIDHYRRTSRTAAREQSMEDVSQLAQTTPPERTGADELEALLAPLPSSQREVIEMLKVAGMSLEEVARATSSTVGSVKQKVHRAYKSLRGRMKALEASNG